jgi:hypothetical protein
MLWAWRRHSVLRCVALFLSVGGELRGKEAADVKIAPYWRKAVAELV